MTIAICSYGQKLFNDAMSWLSIGVDQKINKKVDVKLLTRARIGENFTQLNSWYSDLGIKYDLNKNVSMTLNYVLAPNRMSNRMFKNFHQFYSSLVNKYKFPKLIELENRVIVQRTSSGSVLDSGDPSKNSVDFREKVGIKHKLNKKYEPFVADEILLPMSSQPLEINRNRFYAGVNRTFDKNLNVDFYFVLQSSYHGNSGNHRYYIYGIDLNYQLNKVYAFTGLNNMRRNNTIFSKE